MHHWTQGVLKTVEHSPVLVEHSPCQRNHWTQSGIDSWTQSVLGNHWTQSGIDSWTQDVEPFLGILHCFVVVGLFVWAEWPEVYSCDMDVENILEMSLKDWHHILAFAFLDLNKASNY